MNLSLHDTAMSIMGRKSIKIAFLHGVRFLFGPSPLRFALVNRSSPQPHLARPEPLIYGKTSCLTSSTHLPSFPAIVIFNLENNIFQVVGVERFAPSVPVRHLEIRGELPYEKATRNARLFGKFELNIYGRLT